MSCSIMSIVNRGSYKTQTGKKTPAQEGMRSKPWARDLLSRNLEQ